MGPPLVALSIDLDALDLYCGIYGLPDTLSERARDVVPALATERFGDLCASLGLAGTLFVVGRDVAGGRGHAQLKAAAAAGHELASHSFSHDYALSRRTAAEIDLDLDTADHALAGLTGARPVGFRAPGYTLSPVLSERLAARGYRYDSSLLASPPYYAAKAAVMGALKLLGRESRSILGPVDQLFRPRLPHRDRAGLLELPIAVLPGIRLPYYGAPLVLLPEAAAGLLGRALALDPLVVIELHGVDLCDESDGIPAELVTRQRDLRVSAMVKRRRIESAMRHLLQGRGGVTLAEAARLMSEQACT